MFVVCFPRGKLTAAVGVSCDICSAKNYSSIFSADFGLVPRSLVRFGNPVAPDAPGWRMRKISTSTRHGISNLSSTPSRTVLSTLGGRLALPPVQQSAGQDNKRNALRQRARARKKASAAEEVTRSLHGGVSEPPPATGPPARVVVVAESEEIRPLGVSVQVAGARPSQHVVPADNIDVRVRVRTSAALRNVLPSAKPSSRRSSVDEQFAAQSLATTINRAPLDRYEERLDSLERRLGEQGQPRPAAIATPVPIPVLREYPLAPSVPEREIVLTRQLQEKDTQIATLVGLLAEKVAEDSEFLLRDSDYAQPTVTSSARCPARDGRLELHGEANRPLAPARRTARDRSPVDERRHRKRHRDRRSHSPDLRRRRQPSPEARRDAHCRAVVFRNSLDAPPSPLRQPSFGAGWGPGNPLPLPPWTRPPRGGTN